MTNRSRGALLALAFLALPGCALAEPQPGAAPAQAQAAPVSPARIALLLPLSGRYAPAGEAVRNGVLAAYYGQATRSATIRLYDTGDAPEQAWRAYQQAVDDGAQFVIGPMAREQVAYFALAPHLRVPTLALNYAPVTQPPPGLYQFGLSPEQEAVGAAERAWQDGYRRAAILYPEGDWGQRVAESFMAQWQTLGGTLPIQMAYAEDTQMAGKGSQADYSGAIRQAFAFDQSEARYQRLRKRLGQDIKFTARGREDVDVVFIAAFPRQAHLLVPLLKFHDINAPVYLTSHAFSGVINSSADRDLDRANLADMPWVLGAADTTVRDEINRLWPESRDKYTRLHALGADALRLAPYLYQGQAVTDLAGATGVLRVDNGGQISRALSWVRFSGGVPRPIEAP